MLTLLTGGAIGADMIFEKHAIARKYVVKSFSFEGHHTHSIPQSRIILSQEELKVANKWVRRAAELLKKNVPHLETHTGHLIQRNYYQVVDSEIIYAVTYLDEEMKFPVGGTGWAIAMATLIKPDIPIFVFDQGKIQWYTRKLNIFEPLSIPTMISDLPNDTKFTGIGTREINEYGLLAIEELFL